MTQRFEASVFMYDDYSRYLNARLEQMPMKGRGFRKSLSEVLRCDPSFISKVLQGHTHFSIEQADAINSVLGHNDEQSHCFILLVEYARAGTKSLRSYFKKQLEHVKSKNKNLKHRLDYRKMLSQEHQAQYYSAWYYAAIHIALSIPMYRNPKTLADALNLPPASVASVLDFLASANLAKYTGTEWVIGDESIHISSDSVFFPKSHTNLHLKLVNSLDHATPEDLHFSSIVSLSCDDLPRVKEIMVRAIEDIRGVVRISKEEVLWSYCVDFFPIISAKNG